MCLSALIKTQFLYFGIRVNRFPNPFFSLSFYCFFRLNFGFKLSIYSNILLFPFFFVNHEGTMNWALMIRLMLPSSMTAVGLRTLRRLAALQIFMSLMTKTELISQTHYLAPEICYLISLNFHHCTLIYKSFSYTLLCTN